MNENVYNVYLIKLVKFIINYNLQCLPKIL